MKSIVLGMLLLLLLGGCRPPGQVSMAEPAAGSYEVTDVYGCTTAMPAPPQRILTLSMGTDEILLGLVKPERMAAVNSLLDDPANSNVVGLARQIPQKVGEPTVEQILKLQPDLVIVPDWGNLEQVPSLRDMGLKVVVCKGAANVQEIRETVQLLAQAVGEPKRGEVLLGKMDAKLQEIQQRVERIPPEERKTVVLLSVMAAYGGIGCTFDDACRYAGVQNGMALAGICSGQTMSKEQLVLINPDVLLLPSYRDGNGFRQDEFRAAYENDPALQTVKAVQCGALKSPRDAYIYNGSQDIVFGIQEIAFMAYGEAFAQPAEEHLSAVE